MLRLDEGGTRRRPGGSMAVLLPLAAAAAYDPVLSARHPEGIEEAQEFVARHPSMAPITAGRAPGRPGGYLLALFDENRLRRVLARMLDEEEFLSPYGIRSLSRYHAEHPFVVQVQGHEYRLNYLPAESGTGMFGGNSNWRGRIWMAVNALLIRALLSFYLYYGDNFKIDCPTGSGKL